MRAAMLHGPRKLEIVEVPRPQPGTGEVVVAVAANAICGSDLHSYRGNNPRNKYPKIFGHESAVTVVEVGPGVDDGLVGTRVAIEPNVCCGRCRWCMEGLANLCPDYHVLGESETFPGGCAEYVVAATSQLYVLPDGVSFDAAALVQPLGISYQGVVSRGQVAAGERVLVIGAGPIGLGVMLLARLQGAEVAVTDVESYRLETAVSLGADAAIQPKDLDAAILDWTDGEGVDLCIEAVGGPQHATLETAQRLTRRRGRIVSIGEFTDTLVPFPVRPLKNREQTFMGSIGHPEAFAPVIQLIAEGLLDPVALVSHRVGLDDLEHVFGLLDAKEDEIVKVVVHPGRLGGTRG